MALMRALRMGLGAALCLVTISCGGGGGGSSGTSSPPPPENFKITPLVTDEPYKYDPQAAEEELEAANA